MSMASTSSLVSKSWLEKYRSLVSIQTTDADFDLAKRQDDIINLVALSTKIFDLYGCV